MIEIIGTFNTAKCFASTLEDGAREQIKAVCDTEAFASSKIRIMPDVHAGKGCTIGTAMTITDKIVPSMVGVDIGCGMYTVYLGNINIDFKKVDEAAHFIPCGRNVWEADRSDLISHSSVATDTLRIPSVLSVRSVLLVAVTTLSRLTWMVRAANTLSFTPAAVTLEHRWRSFISRSPLTST